MAVRLHVMAVTPHVTAVRPHVKAVTHRGNLVTVWSRGSCHTHDGMVAAVRSRITAMTHCGSAHLIHRLCMPQCVTKYGIVVGGSSVLRTVYARGVRV